MTTQELGVLISESDEKAFAIFYRDNRAWIYRKARGMLGSHWDAEEAVNTVMMQIWKVRTRYDASKGAWTTFVGIVCHNALLNALQSRNRAIARDMTDLTLDDDDHTLTVATDPNARNPIDELVISENIHRIEDALLELECPRQRTAFILYYFEGYSLVKVGEIIGEPKHRVSTLVGQATRYVRETAKVT